ncbi:MAG: alpha/beta fold hydrolase [Caulobacterales bacterium]
MDLYYAVPQTLVKINRRRRLNLLIRGEGSPTIIFAPGGGATTLQWARVQHPISAKTRTVAYDDAAFGFSDPGPLPRTASAFVNDLRAGLKAAEIGPPYILVGWSLGGLVMSLFAFRYPEDVVGMVMVDKSTEHQDRRCFEATGDPIFAPTQRKQFGTRCMSAERLARSGALKPGTAEYDEFVGPEDPALTPAVNAARVAQLTSPGAYRGTRSMMANLMSLSSDEVDAARRSLGDMPLIVLTGGRPHPLLSEKTGEKFFEVLCTMHDEFAALSTRGERRTVDAGHGIPIEKPEVVIEAIEEVLALARSR